MKTVTLPLEFVKEAYKAACNDWKQRIEEHVPELRKPALEVGKWYKSINDETRLLLATGISGNHFSAYGFSDGKWVEESVGWISVNFIPATDQEVEDALIKEAKRRGFKKGVKFNNAYTESCHPKNSGEVNELRYQSENNGLFTCNQWVFFNGKWAEIIQNPIPKELQKAIDKLGKEKILEYLK